MSIVPKEFFLPLIRKEQAATDTYSFFFDRTQIDFNFIAGNWIRLTLDFSEGDPRGSSRIFSIASSPLARDILMITTKISKSLFKQTLYSLKAGTKVKFFGPAGRFLFNEEETKPFVFLAGGIGVTPFHSMITYVAEKKLSTPITLFASFSTAQELIYYQELKGLENQYIKIIYILTQLEQSKGQWSGETGRISEEMIKKYVSDIALPLYYIAGPPAMVSAIEKLVRRMDVPTDHIRKENFVGY